MVWETVRWFGWILLILGVLIQQHNVPYLERLLDLFH
jgi:hypothetical protein